MDRFIAHVDMDAFFASVEQRDDPVLRGKPVIIGADPKKGKGRGVVSTCSYEARKYGICSAMPISIAYAKCPKGVFLRVDMKKYLQASGQIFKIFYKYTPTIEPVSIDEAFLDITSSYHLFKTPIATCRLIKADIYKNLKLSASIGLASTKLAAKIASDLCKPDGILEILKKDLIDFLWPLDTGKIWGLGKKSQDILNKHGIETIGDLAKADLSKLIDLFGKNGEHFHQLAQGFDCREVIQEEEVKSISNEMTFDKDSFDRDEIKAVLMQLVEKVSRRLRQDKLRAKTITLKIRLTGFKTYTRSRTLNSATNFIDTIYKSLELLFASLSLEGKGVRLVGVKASNLLACDSYDSLFCFGYEEQKKERVHKAIDRINNKYGKSGIVRAQSKLQKTEKNPID